jgi:hypothetical protein
LEKQASEVQLKLSLSLALCIRLAVDHLAEVRVSEKIRTRSAEYHPVEQIEARESQLRRDMFREAEPLAQRNILICVPGRVRTRRQMVKQAANKRQPHPGTLRDDGDNDMVMLDSLG